MSRPARSSANTTSITHKSLPPSHPAEQVPEHRAFLVRSLARNDADLAALIELNRSLRSVKRAIVNTCGELTLLDLGEGKLTLASDGETLEGEPMPEEGQELCVDFLLRMRLRRKLLNRFARRLHRVAHAMDGHDVSPPGPPRYGDLRLHIDPKAIKVFEEHFERQEKARIDIETAREKYLYREQAEADAARVDADLPVVEASGEATPAPAISSEEQPPVDDGNNKEDAPDTAASLEDAEEEGMIDYEALKSFDDEYERRVDPTTGAWTYTILENPVDDDHLMIRFGAGIGATHRSMSAKEKEAEFKRWQTSLLGRIPEQPTFAELGMENRVFLLEERRKRALKDLEEGKQKNETQGKRRKSVQGHVGEDEMDVDEPEEAGLETTGATMDVDDSSAPEEVAAKEGEDDSLSDAPGKGDSKRTSDKAKKNEDNEDNNKKETEAVLRRAKPISLSAVPSFYEQDYRRIYLIHREMVATSLHDHSRRRVEEVVKAYNLALRSSVEYNTRREHMEVQLQRVYKRRTDLNEYNAKNPSAKDNWILGRQQFDQEKLSKLLPSRYGAVPVGTTVTTQYGHRPDTVAQQIAHTVADIVDAVDLISQGKIHNQLYPHKPPPQFVDEEQLENLRRMEESLRKELLSIGAKLRASEEERLRAWKKLIKTKAELDLPHYQVSSYTGMRTRMPLNMSNYHMVPLLSLRLSTAEHVPQELIASANPSLPSYVPNRSPSHASRPQSESRYSAARVRDRIAEDGTVMPVSEPKKTKEGLYLRPAGRTRKGMEWDAVRGIWVPQM